MKYPLPLPISVLQPFSSTPQSQLMLTNILSFHGHLTLYPVFSMWESRKQGFLDSLAVWPVGCSLLHKIEWNPMPRGLGVSIPRKSKHLPMPNFTNFCTLLARQWNASPKTLQGEISFCEGKYGCFSSTRLYWQGHTVASLFLSRELGGWCCKKPYCWYHWGFTAECNSCLFTYWPVHLLFLMCMCVISPIEISSRYLNPLYPHCPQYRNSTPVVSHCLTT